MRRGGREGEDGERGGRGESGGAEGGKAGRVWSVDQGCFHAGLSHKPTDRVEEPPAAPRMLGPSLPARMEGGGEKGGRGKGGLGRSGKENEEREKWGKGRGRRGKNERGKEKGILIGDEGAHQRLRTRR